MRWVNWKLCFEKVEVVLYFRTLQQHIIKRRAVFENPVSDILHDCVTFEKHESISLISCDCDEESTTVFVHKPRCWRELTNMMQTSHVFLPHRAWTSTRSESLSGRPALRPVSESGSARCRRLDPNRPKRSTERESSTKGRRPSSISKLSCQTWWDTAEYLFPHNPLKLADYFRLF